jgi:glycosidase
MRRVSVLLIALALLAACSGDDAEDTTTTAVPTTTTTTTAPTTTTTTLPPTPATAADAGMEWWNDRTFYEVFVRSFKDSDGDGIGDFPGLTVSLDYLNDGDPSTTTDLGITGIWLMPIFPSPSYHGYDVTDYRAINPDYGTMEDFAAFLDAAHDRGIAVIIDLVINHSSREHPWFEASRQGDPEYADWYLWSDTDPGTTGPWGQQVWHADGGRYYFGLFWEGMPDLNLENPDVTAELRDVARFWLEDVGVDGFRLDAARHLIEDGAVMSNTPATYAWLEGFNAFVDGIAPDALVLGEVWSPTLEVASYVPESLDLAFEFTLSEAGGLAMMASDFAAMTAALERALGAYPDGQFATFLTNHDMDRIMSVVGGDVDLAKLAATWLLTSPGVPFLYYGEEVGLAGTKPDPEIRTPMPWTGEEPGVGFTDGIPWQPADPGFTDFNVAAAETDSASLLHHYRSLIHLRADSPALRYGSTIDVETGSGTLFAYLRSIGTDHVLVVGNLTPYRISDYTLDLASGPLGGLIDTTTVVGAAATPPEVTDRGGFLAYRPAEAIPGFGSLVVRFTTEE